MSENEWLATSRVSLLGRLAREGIEQDIQAKIVDILAVKLVDDVSSHFEDEPTDDILRTCGFWVALVQRLQHFGSLKTGDVIIVLSSIREESLPQPESLPFLSHGRRFEVVFLNYAGIPERPKKCIEESLKGLGGEL
jgi:hypothetical protein